MAAKKQKDSKSQETSILATAPKGGSGHTWILVTKTLALPILAAAYSRVSLSALAPVYGSTPAQTYHDTLCATAIVAGASLYALFPELLRKIECIVPFLALSIPLLQAWLFQWSIFLGNPTGPLLTELATIFPLLLVTLSCHSQTIMDAFSPKGPNRLLLSLMILLVGVVQFRMADATLQSLLPLYIRTNVLMTTLGLQFILAVIFAVIFSSFLSWALFLIPACYILFTADLDHLFVFGIVHINAALAQSGYHLVNRQASLTGYVSVLDNIELGFRAMRCDHSLLGGEWTRRPPDYHPKVSDPIYAVFTMLEAVRLVERDSEAAEKNDEDRNALVIGLGIGTTPAALIQHGIDTTIVEIDPVVYRFAMDYFAFPSNHTAVIDDAISFVKIARENSQKYDYIVHDVFTGGVEPVELFTLQFMQSLDDLLKDDGVIAINYAGDISLPGAGIVIRTIKQVFPECRIFRENDGSDDTSEKPMNFINMAVFCKKSLTPPLTFRQPTEDDYLGSLSRKSYMYPQHEIEASVFDLADVSGDQSILEVGQTSALEAYHAQNALGHWHIMRKVLPAKVWEYY